MNQYHENYLQVALVIVPITFEVHLVEKPKLFYLAISRWWLTVVPYQNI